MRKLSDEKNPVKLCHISNAYEYDVYLSDTGEILFIWLQQHFNDVYTVYTVENLKRYIDNDVLHRYKIDWFL